MAVTQLQGPRNVGMDIVDVILSMQSIGERRKYHELQESQLALSREQFGLSKRTFEQRTREFAVELKEKKKSRKQYGALTGRQLDVAESKLTIAEAEAARAAKTFAAGEPIRKLAGVEAKGRKRLVKRFGRADKAVATAKREYDVAKTTGDVARQAETARKYSAVKALYGKSAEMFETILFADEIAKDSRAQLYLAQQGALAANQTTEMIKTQLQQSNMKGQARLKGVVDMVKSTGGTGGPALVNNIDRILDPSQSISDIAADLMGQIGAAKGEEVSAARQGKWIDPTEFTKTEKEKFDPASLRQYEDAFRNTGRGVETMTISRPKSEKRWYWFDNNEMTVTRKRAIEMGVSDLYDAAKSKEAARGKVAAKPTTPGGAVTRTKTVRELADEKVKKTTAVKGKAAPKPTGKKTIGGYTVGQVINRAGKRYKVTGFDTDGEPLVVEIK